MSPSPIEPLSSDATTEHWITLSSTLEQVEHPRQAEQAPGIANRAQQTAIADQNTNRITEAQGWIVGKQGEIILVTEVPTTPLVAGTSLRCNSLLQK